MKFVKWEDYKVLVAKMRRHVASVDNFDDVEDLPSDGDTQPNKIDACEEHHHLLRVHNNCYYVEVVSSLMNFLQSRFCPSICAQM